MSFATVSDLVFAALLLWGAAADIRTRRIPNTLVLALGVLGLVRGLVVGGVPGLGVAIGACAAGLAIWLPLYAFRMLGAGDVKLFAAAAAWLPLRSVFGAAVLTALLGGVLGVVWYLRTHGARFTAVRLAHAAQQPRILRDPLPVPATAARLPYGVAMVAALLITVWRLRAAS